MKDLLLKSSGTLLIGFLALVFTGCKDNRNTNQEYQETYPPSGTTNDETIDSYNNNDTLYPDSGLDGTPQDHQSDNQNSGNFPDDATGTSSSTTSNNNRPAGTSI